MASIRHIWDARVPARDGVTLSLDTYLPGEEGRYPTVLIGTPYDNTMKAHVDMARFFTAHEYAFAIWDLRGRYDSGGDWLPFLQEGPDGFDVVEWIAEQPWSDGKVGMMGGSYRGWVQWAAARLRPPHLTTMVPTATGGKFLQEFPFYNGIPCLWMLGGLNYVGARTNQNVGATTVDWERVYRTLPIEDIPEALGRALPIWKEWMSHPDMDDYWRMVSFTDKDFKSIDMPVLHITGYYDGDQPGALHYYDSMMVHSPAKDKQYMLIGPWDHAGTRFPKRHLGGVDFTDQAVMSMAEVHLRWFDRWMKDKSNEVDTWPRTRYFVMGDNKWESSDKPWAPSTGSKALYLDSGGYANTVMGDGSLKEANPSIAGKDTLTYNPENPLIPGTGFDFYGDRDEPPLDIRYLLRRGDTLVYTSEPLTKPLKVAGRPEAHLFFSSDCEDTDIFTYLTDVHPDGRSTLVSGGKLRARYRNGLARQELLKPGEVYRIKVEMDSTCVNLHPGHRLAVTSSEFPRYGRNQNTGNPVASDTDAKIADNTVHHGGKNSSRLVLPIL
ncbi:MAG: CocE/NonD family hydrolase [Candidatus Bathyarchaeota archaeon]